MTKPFRLHAQQGDVKRNLSTMVGSIGESGGLPGAWALEHFVLRKGEQHKAAPFTGARGARHQCFRNAIELALHTPGLRYAEGFGASVIPVHHAWCVDADGNVIDPTWDHPEDRDYYGITFDADAAWGMMVEGGYYGVLTVGPTINMGLILDLDPELHREITNAR